MTKRLYFIAVLTSAGVVLGSVIWFIVYSIVYTPDIEFNGPASLGLGLTLVAGGLVFGLVGISVYAHKNTNRLFLKAFIVWVMSGFITCLVLGYVIGKYEISHTGYCVEKSPRGTCLDEKGFFLFE